MKRSRASTNTSSSLYVLASNIPQISPKPWDLRVEILPQGWFLQWLENKDYVRSDILLNDKVTMQSLVRLAKKSSKQAIADMQLCEIDELNTEQHNLPECNTSDVSKGESQSHIDAAEIEADKSDIYISEDEAELPSSVTPQPTPPLTPSPVGVAAPISPIGAAAPIGTAAIPISTTTASVTSPLQTNIQSYIIPSLSERSEPHGTTWSPVDLPTNDVNSDDEHQSLVQQLDLLRMRFKECKIPPSVEQGTASINELRNTVHRNMVQLKRNRNIATYKLAMVGCLLVSELFFARFCRLDMSRFMKWHHSNMMSYEELLVEMGEVTTPLSNASPSTQLMMLLFFNTCLFLANEVLSKWFSVDVLNVMGHITGASMANDEGRQSMPQQTTNGKKFEFARDFTS